MVFFGNQVVFGRDSKSAGDSKANSGDSSGFGYS
jgi:hypothetical protein